MLWTLLYGHIVSLQKLHYGHYDRMTLIINSNSFGRNKCFMKTNWFKFITYEFTVLLTKR